MTEAQRAWLAAHPDHRPLVQTGGLIRYQQRGTLKPDGTFVPSTRETPIMETGGSFGVGILMVHEPGRPGVLRDPRKG